MHANQSSAPRLATRPIDREAIAKGYRSPALYARLSTIPARHDALERLCVRAERKPQWLYNIRKDDGRTLPCERLHNGIVDGIQAGYITPEVLADYFGDLFALYRAMMPGAAEATYLDTTRESAEALEAMAVARCNPTPEAQAHAARELLEAAVVSTAHAKQLQQRRA
jgi:hypothetical protein